MRKSSFASFAEAESIFLFVTRAIDFARAKIPKPIRSNLVLAQSGHADYL
jgi:hypothetical protein